MALNKINVNQAEVRMDEGAFNVSMYYAVGNQPATYDTLAEAIAAVPEVYRNGGMTIRFFKTVFGTFNIVRADVASAPSRGILIDSEITNSNGNYYLPEIECADTDVQTELAGVVNAGVTKIFYVEIAGDTATYRRWTVKRNAKDTLFTYQYRNVTNEFSLNEGDWVYDGIDEGIYDISLNNMVEVEGVMMPSQYETLSSALAAIPAGKRKGGMNIKYQKLTPATYAVVRTEGLTEQPTGTELLQDPNIVSGTYTESQLSVFATLPSTINSSLTYYLTVTGDTTTYTSWVITKSTDDTERYVQYRLMNTNWSITPSDWQGVDSVPNLSSENLVKSNGVEVDILSQMKKVGAVVLPLNSDKVYNVGEVGTTFDLNSYTIQATFKSCVFPCSYGDTLTVSGEGTLSASPLFAFVSANNVVLSRATKYVYNNENITVPENTAYVILQSRDLTRGDIKIERNASVAKTIATINTSLASKATKTELNEEHIYVNNHLVVDFQSIKDSYSEDGGMRIDTSGIIGPNTSYDCAVYEFPKGKTYTVNISGGRGDINCRLYGITPTYPITGGDNSQGDSATVGKTSAENVTIDATAQKMYLYVNIPVGNNTSRVYFYATMQEVFTDFATKQELESEHDYVNSKLNISFIAIKNSFSTEGGMRLDGSGTLQKNSTYDCAVYEFPKGKVYTVNIEGGRGYPYNRLYGITTRKPEDIGTGAYNTSGSNDTKGKTYAENVVIDATDNTMYLYIDIPVGNNTSSVYYYASLSDIKHQVDELDVAVVNGDKLHDNYGFLNFVSDNPVKNLIISPSLVSMIDSWGVLGASYDSGEYEYLDDGVVKYEDRYEDSWPQKMGRINGVSVFNFTAGGMSCKAWCQNNPYYPQNRVWSAAQQTENLKQAYVIHFGGLNSDISSVGDLETDVDLNDYNNNADTYAGWLAGVVQRLRSVNPNCFIFMSTMNRWNRLDDQDGQEYDDVVRAIPAFFNNYRIYLLDVRTYGPGTSYASVFNTGGHPNAFGHTYLAFMYNTYLDYVIKNNINDFKEVQFVLDGKHRI